MDRQERQVFAYLLEENRVLRHQLRGQRLQFTDTDRRRRRSAEHPLGRRVFGSDREFVGIRGWVAC